MKFRVLPASMRFAAVTAAIVASNLAIATAWASHQYGSVTHALAYARGERLVVDRPRVDLGVVAAGAKYPIRFRVANLGGTPVRLVGCSTSCDCTTPQDLPATIPPSSTITFDVRYKPRLDQAQPIRLRLYTDHPACPELPMTIRAEVGPPES